jgi:Undecaprenyl-phosphate glucose phosphotransferase
MIKSHQQFLNTIFVAIDCIVITLSLILAWYIRFDTGILGTSEGHLDFRTYMLPLYIIIPLFIFIYNSMGLYSPHRVKKVGQEVVTMLKANAVGVLILTNVLFLEKQVHYSRYVLLLFAIFCVILGTIERVVLRVALRKMRASGFNLKHMLVIGAGELGVSFAHKIIQNKQLGYNVIGFLDDEKKLGYKILNARVMGRIDEMDRIVRENDLDEVIIAIPLKDYERLHDIIKACEKLGVKAQIIPDYYKYLPARPYVDQLDDMTLINIRYIPLDDAFNKLIKRAMDILISLAAIILTSPIMLIAAVIIKLTSPGSILFRQIRVGMHRREFGMYKFRSMRVQVEEEEVSQWTTKNDPRKTKFGDFIRRTSIDELPQLFNVLKGDMSIIGPRPERPYFVDKFKEEIPKYMIKHHVRPGITGWAQVNGFRGDTSIKARIEHDIYYIENWSIWLDIKIIFLTFFKGIVNRNAY